MRNTVFKSGTLATGPRNTMIICPRMSMCPGMTKLYSPQRQHSHQTHSNLGLYSVIMVAEIISFSIGVGIYIRGSIKAARRIHDKLSRSVLRITLRVLDKTPMGRFIARFTQDIRSGELAM